MAKRVILIAVFLSFVWAENAIAQDIEDIKAKNLQQHLDILTNTMKLFAVRNLLKGEHMEACVNYTVTVYYGGTKYKDRLDGVKVLMTPKEITDCFNQARKWLDIE